MLLDFFLALLFRSLSILIAVQVVNSYDQHSYAVNLFGIGAAAWNWESANRRSRMWAAKSHVLLETNSGTENTNEM